MTGALVYAERLAGFLLFLLAAGCATLDPLQHQRASGTPQTLECAAWYAALDAAVEVAGVRDGQAVAVRGFPYMRADRFSAALRGAAMADEPAFESLVDRLIALDLGARGHEISNLSAEQLKILWAGTGEAETAASHRRTRDCAGLLRDNELTRPELRKTLLERLRVPDSYVTAYRIAGLYALTKIPFSSGVRKHLAETQAAFGRDLAATAQGSVVRYSPPSRPHLATGQVREILARSTRNPLRIPEPAEEDRETLFAFYAPSFEMETTGDFDRPGALRWRWGSLPEVDAADPVVYTQIAHTRYRGLNLLQLVYTVWFAERPAESKFDLLAGALDGVVFRVTLAPDGTPLVYDTMHPCGCYHMFFPTSRAVPVAAPKGELEWAFVPQILGDLEPQDRLVVRIASRTHFVERVYRDQTDSLARYGFRSYDSLRSLPRMSGGTRSVFGPDGIIALTNRLEEWLFWPMGIVNAGAMRQWGHHATAFVGRRHFDDPDLLERRFVLDLK